jgi:transposase
MNVTKSVIGVDIAKQVFQVHEVDMATGEITRAQLKRGPGFSTTSSTVPPA